MPVLSHLPEPAVGPPPAEPAECRRDDLTRASATIAIERTRRQDLVASLRDSLGGSVVIRASPETALEVTEFDPLVPTTPVATG